MVNAKIDVLPANAYTDVKIASKPSLAERLVILHVAPITSEGDANGPQYSVPALVGALHAHGSHAALLTTSPHGPYSRPELFPVLYYRDYQPFSLDALPPPYNRPDLLALHDTYDVRQIGLAREARRKGIPYVMTPRGGITNGAQRRKWLKKSLGNLLFFGRMLQQATAIHCLTANEAGEASRWKRPVFVVGNGVDLPAETLLASPGQREGLELVFIGRLDIQHKGLDLLMDACASVAGELRAACVRLALYGPDVSQSRAVLEAMIRHTGIEDLVKLPGPVHGLDKQTVLQSADVFVHASRFEGHPIAVLEALAYGVPCLLTPGTNMADIVAGYGAGWEVEPSAEGVIRGLRAAIASKARLKEMGQAARRMALKEYSWEHVSEQLLGEYNRLLRQPASSN